MWSISSLVIVWIVLCIEQGLGARVIPIRSIQANSFNGLNQVHRDFYHSIKAYRASIQLPPLCISLKLNEASWWKSKCMLDQNDYSHSCSNVNPMLLVRAFGYTSQHQVGENIGYRKDWNTHGMVAQWMKSPRHCATIMRRDYTQVGVAAASASNGTVYWTMIASDGNDHCKFFRDEVLVKMES